MGFTEDNAEVPADPDNEQLKAYIQKYSEEIEQLAACEHDRWVAFHRSEGWRSIGIEEAKTEGYAKYSNKSKKSIVLQMHPDICSYEEITERSKKIGRNDTKDYDICLIQKIPDMFNNVWGVSKEAYHVKKTEG